MADSVTNIQTVFGGLSVCSFISMVFYGTMCMQAVTYYSFYPRDPRYMKSLVAVILLIDTLQQAMLIHSFWWYLIVRGDHNPVNMVTSNWSFNGQAIPTEIGAFVVECYFISRIYLLSERKRRFFLLVLLCVATEAAGFAYIARCFQYPRFADGASSSPFVIAWASCRAATDLAIALTMVSILGWSLKKGFSSQLGAIVQRIITFSLTTGILSSVFAISVLVAHIIAPFNFTYVGMYVIYGKIYANSMLASLNARHSLRAMARTEVQVSTINFHEVAPGQSTMQVNAERV